MTAEAVVMNKQAVAMAADSAVTIGDGKVFNTANKIHSLSPYHPVGLMVFGSADLLGVPWETIIKMFRQEIGQNSEDVLEHYAEALLEFMEGNRQLFPPDQQREFIRRKTVDYLDNLFARSADKARQQLFGPDSKRGEL
ncbi:MAG: hypothetical protein R6V07_01670, partial [Armatimonadota bacterium]